MDNWSIYMVRCKNSTLYTGITTDVERRFAEHCKQGKKCAKYLKGKAPLTLVYQAVVGSRSQALAMEHQIKGLAKLKKENILLNPDLNTAFQ